MASIGAELITYLKTITNVTDLVGTGTAARIYFHEPKQAVSMPYIVIEVFPEGSHEHIAGISGLGVNRIQITAFATTSSGAYDLGEKVRLAPLQGYRGLLGSTLARVTADEGSEREYEPAIRGGNEGRYEYQRDYSMTYNEATS